MGSSAEDPSPGSGGGPVHAYGLLPDELFSLRTCPLNEVPDTDGEGFGFAPCDAAIGGDSIDNPGGDSTKCSHDRCDDSERSPTEMLPPGVLRAQQTTAPLVPDLSVFLVQADGIAFISEMDPHCRIDAIDS